MSKKKKGRIINISSISGLMGNIGQVNYSAAKAGLIGLTKASAQEWANCNITVNAVAPGYIISDMSDAISKAVEEKMLNRVPMSRLVQSSNWEPKRFVRREVWKSGGSGRFSKILSDRSHCHLHNRSNHHRRWWNVDDVTSRYVRY